MTARKIPDSVTVAIAADHLLANRYGREVVVLNLRDGVYYGLEDVGARVWTLLQCPMTLREIQDALVAEYSVEPERCARDVRALVDELLARGLVELREA